MEWAASQGHTILMDPHSPCAGIARERYRELLEAHGHSIEGREISMAQPQPFFSGTQWNTWKLRLANLQLPSTRR